MSNNIIDILGLRPNFAVLLGCFKQIPIKDFIANIELAIAPLRNNSKDRVR